MINKYGPYVVYLILFGLVASFLGSRHQNLDIEIVEYENFKTTLVLKPTVGDYSLTPQKLNEFAASIGDKVKQCRSAVVIATDDPVFKPTEMLQSKIGCELATDGANSGWRSEFETLNFECRNSIQFVHRGDLSSGLLTVANSAKSWARQHNKSFQPLFYFSLRLLDATRGEVRSVYCLN